MQPTVSFHTLYAETIAENIMIAAIQVPTHIQPPVQKTATHLLVSYSNNHQDSILQCAAYGFWAKQKKNALLIQITQDSGCIIQNPGNTDQLARTYSPYITQSRYPISDNNRINPAIEKQLCYIGLLTQIENISIVHIPKDKIFDQSIVDTIYEYTNTDTVVIYPSNHNPKAKTTTDDTHIYTLRQHISKDQSPETLQYKKNTNPLHKSRHNLHQAI